MYWELKEKLNIEKGGNDSLSIEYEEEIQAIFHKFIDVLISNILGSSSNNTN